MNGKVKSVKDYKYNYIIDEYGNVFSIKYDREIKPFLDEKGYNRIALAKDGKSKKFFIHRLVAMSFIDNPENKPFVNHIDGNKLNNHISNLEWCTASENEFHSYRTLNKKAWATGRKGKLHGASKKIKAINPETGFVGVYESRNAASIELNIESSIISRIANGQVKNPKCGFYFEYI